VKKINEQAAKELLMLLIPEMSNKVNYNFYDDQSAVKCMLKLLQVILMFDYEQENNLEKFKQVFLTLLNESRQSQLVDLFISSPSVFLKNQPLVDTVKSYASHLGKKYPAHMVFSWAMPYANIANHPLVQEFFRSERQVMLYKGVFTGISHARNFIQKYQGQGLVDNYSADMTANGSGKNAYVQITKTRTYYTKLCSERIRAHEQLSRIKIAIKQLLNLN
jgi:hypothetical protein